MKRTHRQTAATALGGLAIAVSLAGCASAPSGATSDSAGPSGAASTGDYTDGEYAATGEYLSPNGSESISVDVTLENNKIVDVTVVGDATSGNSLRFQTEFEEGIATEVVGVNIDELNVDKVAGSSLTSDGFNDAIEKIKAEALA